MSTIHWATCSWKYADWRGILYAPAEKADLGAYARRLGSVEVDQWFWSLFPPHPPKLPAPKEVNAYASAVPGHFRFSIKLPNALSLSHYPRPNGQGPLSANPHFLDPGLYQRFLEAIAPLGEKVGVLMLQFEYLNRQKLSGLAAWIERLDTFLQASHHPWPLAIETRNPHFLKADFFDFLRQAGVGMVYCHGYYMPPIWEVFSSGGNTLAGPTLLRLIGPDRTDIERTCGGHWNRLVAPKDEELERILEMIRHLAVGGQPVYVNVNNHYEGCAPLTIARLIQRWPQPPPDWVTALPTELLHPRRQGHSNSGPE